MFRTNVRTPPPGACRFRARKNPGAITPGLSRGALRLAVGLGQLVEIIQPLHPGAYQPGAEWLIQDGLETLPKLILGLEDCKPGIGQELEPVENVAPGVAVPIKSREIVKVPVPSKPGGHRAPVTVPVALEHLEPELSQCLFGLGVHCVFLSVGLLG